MKKVLIIEDEDSLREIISDYFISDGFDVTEAADGKQAIDIIAEKDFDLVLLDIMLPHIDGFSLCRRIRNLSADHARRNNDNSFSQAGSAPDVPIIIMTARSEDDDKLLGYELGADDYITKPFNPRVLLAKAKNLVRRADKSAPDKNGDITAGCITINPVTYSVSVNGEQTELSPKEFNLLLILIQNKNRVMTRDMLLSKVWGYDYFGDSRTVDTHIKLLRDRLKQGAAHIVTQIKVGYKFEENI